MKKLYVLLALLGCAQHCLGQGYVNFANSVTTRVSTNSGFAGNPSTGYTSTVPNSYYYALFVGSTSLTSSLEGKFTDPTSVGWIFTGRIATNAALVGLFTGNGPSADQGVPINIGPVHNGGDLANWMVAGWSADNGSTWAEVEAKIQNDFLPGWFGNSGIGIQSAGDPARQIAPGSLFGPTGTGLIGGFTLYRLSLSPEPSSLALAGLGIAVLMIFRRRK